MLKILDSYLKDRLQYIKIGKVESEYKLVNYSVSQGLILCPLILIIYLIDVLTQKSKESKCILFDDDTVVSNKGSIERAGEKHDAKLAPVAQLFHQLKKQLTKQKQNTWCLEKDAIKNEYKINIDQAEVKQTSFFRYLRLILDSQLKFCSIFTDYALFLREHSF